VRSISIGFSELIKGVLSLEDPPDGECPKVGNLSPAGRLIDSLKDFGIFGLDEN
jgi:hypothetical protein